MNSLKLISLASVLLVAGVLAFDLETLRRFDDLEVLRRGGSYSGGSSYSPSKTTYTRTYHSGGYSGGYHSYGGYYGGSYYSYNNGGGGVYYGGGGFGCICCIIVCILCCRGNQQQQDGYQDGGFVTETVTVESYNVAQPGQYPPNNGYGGQPQMAQGYAGAPPPAQGYGGAQPGQYPPPAGMQQPRNNGGY